MKICLRSVALLGLLPGLGWSDPPSAVETPAVPARWLKTPELAATGRDAEASPTKAESLRVQPGVNEIIPVALGHLNRLILPFEQPAVRTVNPASCQLEGRVLYLAPADENPVTLYVTPEGSEDVALSLTLAPRRIPPREIRLTLDAEHYRTLEMARDTGRASVQSGPSAPLRREPPDYIADLKQTFRALALGQTPQGFELRTPAPGETVRCAQPDLRVTAGQALDGRDLVVLVAVARNGGASALELDERACAEAGREVVAIAAWPKVRLAPGEASELYVAYRKPTEPETSTRPSLLDGGRR